MAGKRKFGIWCGATVALVALVCGGRYAYSNWELNNDKLEQLKQKYAEVNVLEEKNAQREASKGMATGPAKRQSPRLNITFRAIGLERVSPGADQEIAFNVLNEMRNSAYFEASETKASDISAEIPLSEPPVKAGAPLGTFSFKVTAKLKRPLTL